MSAEARNIFEMDIHPANNVFPMMSDEELESLAESIKENGQIHPIAVKDGVLIDGKCRLAACKIAGVTPETLELGDDVDPATYNISMNVMRQYHSPGQYAMHEAMLTDEGENEGSSLKKARYVLAAAPTLAESVIKGYGPLEKVYVKVKAREAASKLRSEKTAWLRKENPALLEMVQADKLDIDAAITLESDGTALPWEDGISENDKLNAAFDSAYKSAIDSMSKAASQQTKKVIADLGTKLLAVMRQQATKDRRQHQAISKAFK